MLQTQTRKTMIAAALLTFLIAAPALARGHRPPPGHAGGAHAMHARGILSQLIFPCRADCADTARTCLDAADGEAVACISDACAVEITAAQTACAENRSEECMDAYAALADCADACLDTRTGAVDVCRDTQRDCREACEAE